jgi:hypothetical protein
MTKRRCAGCNKVIDGRPNKLYCSDKCRNRTAVQRRRTGDKPSPLSAVPSVIRGTNGVLIATVARLGWLGEPDDTVLDMTYGEGKWWTVLKLRNLIAHDLALDGVDFRHLPEADQSVRTVCYDPPYITTGSEETSTLDDFYDRYGLGQIRGWQNLRQLIADGLAEAARVVMPGGYVLVKCEDYTESDGKRFNYVWLVNTAETLGLELQDRVIHYTGPGPQPKQNRDGSPRRQVHVREAASFLCCFKRTKPGVNGQQQRQ